MSGQCRNCGYDGCVCDDNDRYNIPNDLSMTNKLDVTHKLYRDYIQPSPPPQVNYLTKLEELAQAVVDRWDTPSWKDTKSTAEYINALRNHLMK